jgi:hypothetical protein
VVGGELAGNQGSAQPVAVFQPHLAPMRPGAALSSSQKSTQLFESAPLFESAGALVTGVIRGFSTASSVVSQE